MKIKMMMVLFKDPKIYVSLALSEMRGGEVRQRVGLGRRCVNILSPQIFNQTS